MAGRRKEPRAHEAAPRRAQLPDEDAEAVALQRDHPLPTRAASLDRDPAGPAPRSASPDPHPVSTGECHEREAEGGQRWLRAPALRSTRTSEVEAGLEDELTGNRALGVADLEPGDERDAVQPHAVERLRDPALVQAHRHGVPVGWVRVPAELRDPPVDAPPAHNMARPNRS